LAESLGRFRANRRRALRLLVHARVGGEPPVFAFLVDLALADQEAGVEPLVWLFLGRELDAGEDRAPVARGIFLDTLAVDRDEDFFALACADEAAQVRGPPSVLAAPRIVSPDQRTLDLAGDSRRVRSISCIYAGR
jgi:hypothetical protein